MNLYQWAGFCLIMGFGVFALFAPQAADNAMNEKYGKPNSKASEAVLAVGGFIAFLLFAASPVLLVIAWINSATSGGTQP